MKNLENYDEGIKLFSLTNENLIMVPGASEQVLILKGLVLPKGKLNDIRNQVIPIINKFKKMFEKFGIDLKLINYEQPFYNDILTKEQFLNTPYDLFFSVQIKDILETEERFLEFMVLKDRLNLLLLEDVINSNPVYQKDPWYSDEINNLVCWKCSDKMTKMIQKKFGSIIEQLGVNNKGIKELSELFTSVSNTPPYYKHSGDESNFKMYKIINILQMAKIFTMKELNIIESRKGTLRTEEKINYLLEDIRIISENFNNTDIKNSSTTEEFFNHLIPLAYRRFLVLGLLDKEIELNSNFLKKSNENASLIELLELETIKFIERIKLFLRDEELSLQLL